MGVFSIKTCEEKYYNMFLGRSINVGLLGSIFLIFFQVPYVLCV